MMRQFLIRHFVPDSENVSNPAVRERYGLLSSLVGICCNALLFICKFAIGTISGSVSIMADSINNLSDMGSSVVTLVGFRVSGKPADEDHPFGHARAEYIGGLIVSFMILLLGVEFFRTSLDKVLHPESLSLSPVMLMVLALSVGVKVWMASFNRFVGKRIDSTALMATAQDSLNDVITTSAVLLAALVATLTGWQLDGWMGLVVAGFILFAGFSIARDTVGPLLGQSPPQELVDGIERKVRSYPGILGIHDLMVHSYGPGRWFASLHVEVDASDNILHSHDVIDNIERDVLSEMGVHLVIHLDPIVVGDPVVDKMKSLAIECVKSVGERMTLHDFRLVQGETHSNLIFDVVVPIEETRPDNKIASLISEAIHQRNKDYYAVITIDRSYVSTNHPHPDAD